MRRALSLALDRKSIVDAIYYGIPTPTESFLPQESFYYNQDLPVAEFDLEKAARGAGRGRLDARLRRHPRKGRRAPVLQELDHGRQPCARAGAAVHPADLAQIGVEMEISNMPPAVMWGEYWQMSEFDSVIVGIIFTTGPDPDVSNYLHSSGIPAPGRRGSEHLAIQERRGRSNCWKRAADLRAGKAQGGLRRDPGDRHEDLPLLPMFQYANLRGHKTALRVRAEHERADRDLERRRWRWA